MFINLLVCGILINLSFIIFFIVADFFQKVEDCQRLEDTQSFNKLIFDECIIIDGLIDEKDIILDHDKEAFNSALKKGMVSSSFLMRLKGLYDISSLEFLSPQSNKGLFLSKSIEANYNIINKSIIFFPQYVILGNSRHSYSFPVVKITTMLHEIGHTKDKLIALYTPINIACKLGWVLSLLASYYLAPEGPKYFFLIVALTLTGLSLHIVSSVITYTADKYAEEFSIKEMLKLNQDQTILLKKYLCYQSQYYLKFLKNTLIGKVLALLLSFVLAIVVNIALGCIF